MSRKFSQDDAFPVIARLILTLHETKQDFVSHDELVRAFLNDEMGVQLVEQAQKVDDAAKSKEWWASNMVQWFSQRITEEKSEYRAQFERKTMDGAWGYKPVC